MTDSLKIKSPQTQTEFDEYYNLRWEMLRKPWNKEPGSEKDEGDKNALHFMAMINDSIAGVARLQFNSPNQAQLRYMAVSSNHQKNGIGSALLNRLEAIAKENGATELILQARDVALDFYKSNQYIIIEKTYLLFDSIQHYLMKKEL
ncbi:MAG: GNAT family N-acetyltransferase [Bacteroidia bacterium]|nr:GNAT family N-acetyltransferase [Bacteroidia bacterium]NNC86575.1 GNAT family N-acetyltransferase [Bacteroidia bacterium]NNM15369.1 GNAT family N-acetyltransferase [Bacteroidia bacterium]